MLRDELVAPLLAPLLAATDGVAVAKSTPCDDVRDPERCSACRAYRTSRATLVRAAFALRDALKRFQGDA